MTEILLNGFAFSAGVRPILVKESVQYLRHFRRGMVQLSNVRQVNCKDIGTAMDLLRKVRCPKLYVLAHNLAATPVMISRMSASAVFVMWLAPYSYNKPFAVSPARGHHPLVQGHANRSFGGHALNAQSSRSHAIFTLWCKAVHAGQPLAINPTEFLLEAVQEVVLH